MFSNRGYGGRLYAGSCLNCPSLTKLSRVSDGQFKQDPAYNRPPYPRFENTSLFDVYDEDDDEYRFLQVELRRAQNDAVHELSRLQDELPN